MISTRTIERFFGEFVPIRQTTVYFFPYLLAEQLSRKLKIAVNTRLLLKDRLEGIGWFTYETMQRITGNHPEHQFYFIFDRPFSDEFVFNENVVPVVAYPQARHPILHYLWFEYSVPYCLKKIKPDLFISPDAYCSLSARTKTLIVIHDLNFEHFPEHMPLMARKFYRYFTPRYARHADHIVTVSNFSKSDISEKYGITPDKIDVVYNGVSDIYQPADEEKKERTRQQVSEGRRYFIFIGALNPRKNLANLFRAFDLFKKSTGADHKLLVVGEKMYWPKDLKACYNEMEFNNDVVFKGRQGINSLSDLVASADALTFVSYFEGFGIPIVEAFKAGTPVITSSTSAMPEIAGNAALITDPGKPDEIARAMETIVSDPKLSAKLVSLGMQRAENFNWDKTAEGLWKAVVKTIQK